jgi:hypothetical protein
MNELQSFFNEIFDKAAIFWRKPLTMGSATAVKQYDALLSSDNGKAY